ncbi:peptide MFS transporter [Corynebacterium sp. sy039]|uniref:peptide MFS transporter n=1 Tax=Corynebacterium sp. sy039 TaxID=2599641 RepID=UPI0011B76230|nr:peptide MFS transporter [Corynebacterium sp. sy039]QDZ42159.1 peptide MFS transporter [Corynebacterium sp. sy039]
MSDSLSAHSAQQSEEPPAVADREHGFFGHPWGLANLSAIEMWERFSFYGMQTLVAYYIYYSVSQGGLGYSETVATSILGAYGGLVYLFAIAGAWVSDRVLGAERTLTIAAVLIMCGHLTLSFLHSLLGVGIGLVLIAIGSGALKTTTSVVIGSLYRRSDSRRDAAFSFYYMGINIGALVGPILTGILWKTKGFHWGFALAAIGMALGLTQYLFFRKRTLSTTSKGAPNPAPKQQLRVVAICVVVGLIALIAVCALGVVTLERLSSIVTVVTLLASLVLFTVLIRSQQLTKVERSRVYAFIPMFFASSAFWALFQQQFTSIAVLADKQLDRHIFGMELPPSVVQSINPMFVIIFAGIFSVVWLKLGDRQPPAPMKFAFANIIMGIAFLVFIPFTKGLIPMYVIVVVFFLFTIAELLLSPLGMSLATKLAPQAFNSQMVALFFMSISVGTAASGWLADFYVPGDAAATNKYFLFVGVASIVLGIILAVFTKPIVKLMQGVR